MQSISVHTKSRREFVDVTDEVQRVVHANGVREGICVVYCPHTTAAVTVNENADPDVVHDMLLWMGRSIPKDQSGFQHGEGNSDSHIQCSLVGPSQTLIVAQGKIVLGRWQGIYFCEFDGPRTRTLHVQVVGGGSI